PCSRLPSRLCHGCPSQSLLLSLTCRENASNSSDPHAEQRPKRKSFRIPERTTPFATIGLQTTRAPERAAALAEAHPSARGFVIGPKDFPCWLPASIKSARPGCLRSSKSPKPSCCFSRQQAHSLRRSI